MVTFRDLLERAHDAYERSEGWARVWGDVGPHVEHMAAGDAERRQVLIERLLAVVVEGDDSGVEPPGSDWTPDDDAPDSVGSSCERAPGIG